MKIAIGQFVAATSSVPVTFTEGDIVHSREVNAVVTDQGKYDAKATKARVEEVGLGVAAKIAAGVIRKAEPLPEPPALPPEPSPGE